VLPLVVGQLLCPAVRRWADRHRKHAGIVNSLLVLFVVYAAFCGSVQSGALTRFGWLPALQTLVGAALLFAFATGLTVLLIRRLDLPPGDRIAALFCAPQKTLAAGAPMAKLIFAANPALGLILLPILFYHPLQLFVGGLLVNGIRRRTHEKETHPAAADPG
jgi:solute carrier family 10 (sodium/bile acid cotransporter), member 7